MLSQSLGGGEGGERGEGGWRDFEITMPINKIIVTYYGCIYRRHRVF